MCAGSGRARYQRPYSPAVSSNPASEALPSDPMREAGPSSRPTLTAANSVSTAAGRIVLWDDSPAAPFKEPNPWHER